MKSACFFFNFVVIMQLYRKKQNSRIFLKKRLTNTAECDILYKSS